MSEQHTEQQEIVDARRVETFLADAAVKRALNKVRDQFYAEFLNAKTTDERTNAWAKSHALAAMTNELVTTMSNGKVAQHMQKQRDEREERERQIAARKSTGRK